MASLNGTGGYAERVAVPTARLIEIPDGMPLRDAVALLADGRTALALAGRAGLRAGDTVLVEAAAGGVGTLLVQLARNAGARVVALAGQSRKLAIARDLGADLTVDYSRDGWDTRVRNAVGEVDVVFDGVGGDIGLAAFGLLATGGRFCPFGMASGRFARVTPELAQARQVTIRARRGREPRGTGGPGPDGPGRGRGGPPAAGHRPGIRAGRSRRRARGDRGQDDGRQDAADGAPVTAAWSGAGEGTAGVDRSPFGLTILIFVTISLYERLYFTVPPPAPSDWRHPAQFRRIVRDPRAWDDMHRTCRSRT